MTRMSHRHWVPVGLAASALAASVLVPGIASAHPPEPAPPPPGTSEDYQLGYQNIVTQGIKGWVVMRGPFTWTDGRQVVCAGELETARGGAWGNPGINERQFMSGCDAGISELMNTGYVVMP